jgi:hypothetical protein
MKNIKNLFGFNKIKSKKNRTLLLAGLIGLMPACKQQINEPENPSKHPNTSFTYDVPVNDVPVDSFMKHVPNVENVKFYQPREDTHYIHFSTANGDVNKMTEERDVAQTGTDILYPLNFTRTDNQSVNGTARFVSEPTWTYTVSYKTPNNETRIWSIEDMTLADYSTFSNFSPAQMSSVARSFILQRNPNETAHADSIWANIYTGRSGTFTQNNPFSVQFNSKGAQQGLQHSDFGTFTYTAGSESETQMYSGANKEDETIINILDCPATSMKMTAFANVKRRGPNGDGSQLLLTTGKDSARYVIDEAKNETIVMPFKNWYTVTIIKTPTDLYSYMTDSANIVPSQWQFIHTDKVENVYLENILPNKSFVMTGVYEIDDYNGFKTDLSRRNFLNSDGTVEVVGQGYREDYTNSDRVSFTFCFGGTERTNNNGTATGLELIYCAPQRQR